MYRLTFDESSEYTLHAGKALGVADGATFDVYSDRTMSQASFISTVTAERTTAFTTRIRTIPSLPPHAFAVQKYDRFNQALRLYIKEQGAFRDYFIRLGDQMWRTDASKRSFRVVDGADTIDLAVAKRDGAVQFQILDQVCQKYGMTDMRIDDDERKKLRMDDLPVDSNFLMNVFHSAANFYWNLRHSNKKDVFTRGITVECFKLVSSGKLTDYLEDILIPDPFGQNLNVNGTINIDVDETAEYNCCSEDTTTIETAKYGFRITNNIDVPLYAALFYFDVNALSIGNYRSIYSSTAMLMQL